MSNRDISFLALYICTSAAVITAIFAVLFMIKSPKFDLPAPQVTCDQVDQLLINVADLDRDLHHLEQKLDSLLNPSGPQESSIIWQYHRPEWKFPIK